MTDARIVKLIHCGVDADAAAILVAAGIDTPRKIKAAKNDDLVKAKVDKDAKVKKWQGKK